MKFMSKFVSLKTFVLALAIAAGSSITAQAQVTQVGSFKIDKTVHWGSAVLSPGAYKFTMDSYTFPTRITVRKTTGDPVAIVLAMGMTTGRSDAPNELALQTQEGETYVSSLALNNLGITLFYATPKSKVAPATEARLQTPGASGK